MSSRGNAALLLGWAAAGLLVTGCMLGGDGDEDLSPYEDATLSAETPVGVGDGLTGIEVTIEGDPGDRLVLEVIGEGAFRNPDPGKTKEKTVFLADVEGVGRTTAEVVATQAGTVAVAFKPDPLRGSVELRFLPVVWAAGTPSATKLHPGLVESELCFAFNTTQGLLATQALLDPEAPPEGQSGDDDAADLGDDEDPEDDGFAEEFAPAPGVQATALISATAPEGLDCPPAEEALDELGWVGYAKMFVRTDLEHAFLVLDYRKDANGGNLYTRQIEVNLDPFPGYDVTAEDPVDNLDYVEVAIHVDYGTLGDLGGEPAGEVELTQRCIPDCPALLGTSVGGPDDAIVTDANGDVTLFFDPADAGTYVWFVNLSGGIELRMSPDLSF